MSQFGTCRRGQPRSAGGRFLRIELLEQRQLMTVAAGTSLSAAVAVPLYQEITKVNANGTVVPLATSGPTGYTPAQIRHAYGFDQIAFSGGTVAADGSGETIAIVDAYDDPNIASDLHQFDVAFGLSDPSFTKVNQNGGTSMPQADAGWATEIALDVEWAHAIAPKAKILLVEAGDASYSNLLAAVNYARNAAGVAAVSMSWGGGEFNGETNYDSYFTTPSGHSGVAFVVASGDSGAPAEYPAASPNVLSVGGSSLYLNSQGTISSETAWSGSTGGLSTYEPEPAFQHGVVTQTTTRRATPDVAYDSNPNTGFPVYDSYGTSAPWGQYGGTSDAAPQWSALIAIADQGRALSGLPALSGAQLLTSLYQLPASDFHDVVAGSSSGNQALSATSGYDLVTGRGTPAANLIVSALVGSTSSVPAATHLGVSAPGSTTAGGTFSISVSALNASNTTVVAYTGTIHFSSSDVAAGLPADYTFTSADNGVHTFTGLTLKTAGSQSLVLAGNTTSTIAGSTFVAVNPAAANHLVFVQQPTTVVAGSVFSPAVAVRVLDAYNNLLPSDNSDSITLSLGTNPNGGSLGGSATVTAGGGIATFGNLSIGQSGSGYTLVARSASLIAATSNSFNVTSSQTSGNSVIEGFEGGLSAYQVVGAASPSASVSTSAAHDGTKGLSDANGNDWIYRNDTAAQVKRGDTISVWVQFSGSADGRAYFGFGASSTGTLSLVAAANTKQLILQSNSGYGYVNIAAASQTWLPNHWYRLEADWGFSGNIVGKLFDSDGTTLLQTVSGANTTISSGGVAFRSFGSNKLWDTVSLSSGVNSFAVAPSTTTPPRSSQGSGRLAIAWPAATIASLTSAASGQDPRALAAASFFQELSYSPPTASSQRWLDELTLGTIARGIVRSVRS
jgi:hypothetical protein